MSPTGFSRRIEQLRRSRCGPQLPSRAVQNEVDDQHGHVSGLDDVPGAGLVLQADELAHFMGRHGEDSPQVLQALFAPQGTRSSQFGRGGVRLVGEGRCVAHPIEGVEVRVGDE